VSAWLAKAIVGLVAMLLILLGLGLAAIETGWVKNRLRDLIVRQANNYLTATLTIGRLEGSLVRGLQLGDISLTRDGHTLIHVDEIALSYSIRELVDRGTVIRRVRLTRPYVVGAKMADGRWDLGALVKRESREQERTGPNRPIQIQSIEVVDGHVFLRDPLDFGAAHVPTDFQRLNASFSFTYVPVRWTLDFARVSWLGYGPDLSVDPLSGRFGRGPNGWFFERFVVNTPQSRFGLDGTIRPGPEGVPTVFDLKVSAPRFAFQEWSGVLRGLRNIAISSSFDVSLKGPTNGFDADIDLKGTGGAVRGRVTLDSSVPGWLGRGAVDVERLNLARWLNREERPSDITGHVTFDLALELGRRFPRGRYRFDGPHAMYMKYAGDQVHARGEITAAAVLIAQADAVAYGATVTTHDSSIGIDEPFPFRFQGHTTRIDLRRVPAEVPVPHVESLLTFDYDVTGQFSEAFIRGRAAFEASQFLGAAVGAGTVGSIDTQQKPFRYNGDGEVDGIDLRRFGEGLDIGWMRDPRYAGTVAGHFWVDGTGSGPRGVSVSGGGRLHRAQLFKGTLSDAEVSIAIAGGTLRASFDGRLSRIDPAVPFDDARFAASLTGTGRVEATVHDLMTRATTLGDYDVAGSLALQASEIHGVAVGRGSIDATLRETMLRVVRLETAAGPIEGRGSGAIALVEGAASDFEYDFTRVDLGALRDLHGQDVDGVLATKGRLTGPWSAVHLAGNGTLTQPQGFDASALTVTADYDATIPGGDASQTMAHLTGRGEFITVAGQAFQDATGIVTYDAQRLGFDLRVVQQQGRSGQLAGNVELHPDRHEALVHDLAVTLGRAPWRLVPQSGAPAPPGAGDGAGVDHPAVPTISWSDDGVAITPVEFVDPGNDQRIGVAGTWRRDGQGALHVTARHVFLDTLQTAFERPTRFAGALDLDATVGGTRDAVQATGTVTVTNGRVERVAYQRLDARFTSNGQLFDIRARLDQAPGVWLTAAGTLPLGLFDRDLPEQPLDLAVESSTISLGLVEGVTDVVRNVSGEVRVKVRAVGTSRDPHLDGAVDLTNAAFLVTASGARYKNVRAQIGLARDKIAVESLHVEDVDGHPLDVQGSLATHELRVADVEIQATARKFEVMRNELGRVDIDASLQVNGRFEQPRIAGDLTITTGSVRVDEILSRALFQPYSTEPQAGVAADPLAALNPWERLGLDVALHVPGTLRLQGDNVQISAGTPIGLGDINLTVTGDLYLYKDTGQPLFLTGSFDQIRGTYAFQGRRFDVDPASSINFRGDLNPELYVTVTRVIQGIETRVSIFGEMSKPELRLASTPPLDSSDVLSLIVFNQSVNELSAPQQQQLLVRAGTLAAGFLAGQVLSTIQSKFGLEVLEVETSGQLGGGPKLTVGDEIAPGLVARFSREFGSEPYDEATIEYYLSRILRLRATFSDAQSLNSRSPFRRVERAGIDLLLFFSF
jgi:autotransporter translocation and assembly factor TamB